MSESIAQRQGAVMLMIFLRGSMASVWHDGEHTVPMK